MECTKPISVLYVHCGDNWIRGSERVLLDILSNLDRGTVLPSVWCNSPVFAKAIQKTGIACFITEFKYYFAYNSPKFNLRKYASLVREGTNIVRQVNADLIHVNGGAPTQWMLPIARSARIPILTHLHTFYLRRSRYVFGFHLTDCIVGVTRAVVRDLIEDGMDPARIRVVPNGIDPARMCPDKRIASDESVRTHPDEFVLASIGSLIPRKGHDLVIEAVRQLCARSRAVRLLVIGEGPERTNLEALARGLPVVFLGERADIGRILENCVKVLVLASRQEAMGLVIVEAAYIGIPAIGTSVGGIPEVIKHGETGLVVPPEEPRALAEAVEMMMTHEHQRISLGQAARRRAGSNYMISGTVQMFVGEYRGLLAASNVGMGRLRCLRPYARLALGAARALFNRVVPDRK